MDLNKELDINQLLINKGIDKKLISINEETNYITYIHQKKSRNYKNPEERVQAIVFLKLVLESYLSTQLCT